MERMIRSTYGVRSQPLPKRVAYPLIGAASLGLWLLIAAVAVGIAMLAGWMDWGPL